MSVQTLRMLCSNIYLLWNGNKTKKYLGPVSTIRRLLTHNVGDPSSCFNKIDEIEAGISKSSLKHMLIDNRFNNDNKGSIKAHLPLEYAFGFNKNFIKN